MKTKSIYTCNECQFESGKWLGRCPTCDAWNSFTEEINKPSLSKTPRNISAIKPELLIVTEHKDRIISGIQEFDRVTGDGLVVGSLTLLSGEPGIGKSTLTLQIASKLSQNYSTLIISGEETISQIANRAKRLKLDSQKLSAINEHNVETIIETIKIEKPKIVIIDSIQVISSHDSTGSAGSISQVRYCTELLMEHAKTTNTTVILIGHVTKDGTLAGPKVLEHLVDTVLLFEGDRFQQFRLLRSSKNRFGSCAEVGIFEMTELGLIEIKNPSKQFLEGRKENAIGSVITVSIEGTRPFLVEVQALVSTSAFGFPKRTANGFDLNRLQILIAVLEKHGKLNLQNQDVFVNIVGGIKLKEPSSDLAVLMAIASSLLKRTLPKDTAIFGEVGLSGELRKVSHFDKRKKEASSLELNTLITPETCKDVIDALSQLR